MPDHAMLTAALEAAVPLWIQDMKDLPFAERQKIGLKASDVIASRGDIIQYRSARKGETAKAFNELAKGLAVLAYMPGGVKFAGLHFCVNHEECIAADRAAGEVKDNAG